MIELLIERLCGKAVEGDKICFSIPSSPPQRKSDLIFHERSVMSICGGMCNICLAYLGLPVFTLATTRAGDYIDHSAASVTGETPTTVRLHKENGFPLNGAGG